MKGRLERAETPAPRLGELLRDINHHGLVNGFVAFLFATTGPLAIILTVATEGGLREAEISSWIFAAYGIGGVMSVLFSLLYRMPIAMAWTIPGTVLLGPALEHLSLNEIVFAYMATAALITLLGVTGWVARVMALFPLPIVMAMVAGVFLPLGLNIITAFQQAWWIALAMLAGFVLMSAAGRFAQIVPPVLVALLAGAVVIAVSGGLSPERPISFTLAQPILFRPEFSWAALAELVLPLTITVVGIQNAQGFVILRDAGYRPPQNMLTLACGVGSFFFGLFGSVSACVTGPSNAILNASGAPARRYVGGIAFGLLMLLFGVFAPVTASLGLAVPAAFIGMLGGLALLGVLQSAFTTAFGGSFRLGALVTFLVTISDVAIFNIGAAFWGLVFGYAASRLLEPGDFSA